MKRHLIAAAVLNFVLCLNSYAAPTECILSVNENNSNKIAKAVFKKGSETKVELLNFNGYASEAVVNGEKKIGFITMRMSVDDAVASVIVPEVSQAKTMLFLNFKERKGSFHCSVPMAK